MSFKLFIYYCALCGGWAGLLSWAVAQGVSGIESEYLQQTLIAAMLGFFLAAGIGAVDALLNDKGFAGVIRVGIAVGISLFGAMLVGLIGQWIKHQAFTSVAQSSPKLASFL